MTVEISNLEKFLTGIPLNEELAALKEGRAAEVDPMAALNQLRTQQQFSVDNEDRDLTRDERELLREAKMEGLFTVLVRLHRKALKIHIRSATIESENDPLKSPQDLAAVWAYVKMFRKAMAEQQMLVEAEIARLEGD